MAALRVARCLFGATAALDMASLAYKYAALMEEEQDYDQIKQDEGRCSGVGIRMVGESR